MGKIKDDLKLIDYLNEKGIKFDDLKDMIEKSINTALEEEKEEKKEEPQESEKDSEEEEVPTFSKDDIVELIDESVKSALKIKRKVPSKGNLLKDKPEETIVKKNWFEIVV